MNRDETIKALRFAESAIALKPTVPVDVEAVRAALHYLTTTCATCQHFDRVGIAYGYCASAKAHQLGVGDSTVEDCFQCPCHTPREEGK